MELAQYLTLPGVIPLIVNPEEMHMTKKRVSDHTPSFKAAQDTKKVDLKEGDSSKQVSIGSGLDPK